MQMLITSLKLIQIMIISVYLLCVGDLSLIISDQEDESNGKLTARYWHYNMWYYSIIAYEERLTSFSMISLLVRQSEGVCWHLYGFKIDCI